VSTTEIRPHHWLVFEVGYPLDVNFPPALIRPWLQPGLSIPGYRIQWKVHQQQRSLRGALGQTKSRSKTRLAALCLRR